MYLAFRLKIKINFLQVLVKLHEKKFLDHFKFIYLNKNTQSIKKKGWLK